MGSTKAAGQNARAHTHLLTRDTRRAECAGSPDLTRRAFAITRDAQLLGLCQDVLASTQYVLDHTDSIEAVDVWKAAAVDILFVDHPLTTAGAPDLVRRMKRTFPRAALILVTDDVTVEALLSALHAGVVDCLIKPLTRGRLREAVTRAVEVDDRNRDYAVLKAFSPLFEATNDLSSSLDLDELLSSVARHATTLANAHASHVALIDPNTHDLVFQAGYGNREQWERTHRRIVGGPAHEAVSTGRCVSIPDLHTGTPSECLTCAEQHGLSSSIWVPLSIGKHQIGAVAVCSSARDRLRAEEMDVLRALASYASSAVERARLYQNACYLLEEESALYSLAKAISSSSSAEELLNKATPLIAETLRGESCIVCLVNPATNRLFLVRSVGIPDEYLKRIAQTVDAWPIHSEVLSGGETVIRAVHKETSTSNGTHGESLLLGSYNGLAFVLSTPLTIHQRSLGVVTIARRANGGEFLHRDRDLLANMASQLSVAIEELRLRTRDMLTLYELSQFSGTTLNLEEIYQKIANKVESLFACEGLCLLISNKDDKKLEIKAASGAGREQWRALERLPLDYLAERLASAHQLPLFALVDNGGRRVANGPVASELVPWPTPNGLGHVLVAPMVVEGSITGALAVSFRGDQSPWEDRPMLLTSLALEAALVIRNASLYAASQELAIREERNRIAREFHDGVAQNLAHLMHKMQLISRLLEMDIDRAKMELERSRITLEESVKELRRCIYALGPVHLEGQGISQALEKIATEFAEQNELQAAIELGSVSTLPSRVEATLFRIVQEALNNIRKHAKASRFGIVLKMNEDYLHLVIEDDGVGFDCDATCADESAHFGVPQMKERARELGGYLEVRSSPGKGTTIELWVPVGDRGKLDPDS